MTTTEASAAARLVETEASQWFRTIVGDDWLKLSKLDDTDLLEWCDTMGKILCVYDREFINDEHKYRTVT
jgi:hypothetical protein